MRRPFLACTALLALLVAACKPMQSHDVLTFFFDGVDRPIRHQWDDSWTVRGAADVYKEGDDQRVAYADCNKCHVASDPFRTPGAAVAKQPSTEPVSEPTFVVAAKAAPAARWAEPVRTATPPVVPAKTLEAPAPKKDARPAVTEASKPVVTAAAVATQPAKLPPTEAKAPVSAEIAKPPVTEAPKPAVTEPAKPSVTEAAKPASQPDASVVARASIPPAQTSSESLAGQAGSDGGIHLQVAAFLEARNAAALKSALERELPSVRVDELPAHGKMWYRVRVGPLATNAEADRAEQRLRAMGHAPVRYGKPKRPD